MGEHQDLHVQVVDHSGETQKREQGKKAEVDAALMANINEREVTYMFIFCLALSISLLTSGVMLKRSF